MDRPRRIRTAYWVAALAVSLLLHALLGTGLWSHRNRGKHGLPAPIATQVDGPDDGGMELVLRDPPEVRIIPRVEPRTLPPLDVPPLPLREPVIPVGIPANSTPTSPTGIGGTTTPQMNPGPVAATIEPLHGRLKPGKSIVYLIDRSSSMTRGKAWSRATEAIRVSLGQLDPDARFEIVAYNGGTTSFARGLAEANEDNRRRAVAWLERLIPEGGSDHTAGFKEAIHRQSDVVFLLTDADDLDSTEIRRMEALIHRDVMIQAVLFTNPSSTANVTPFAEFLNRHRGTIRHRP